ncbi:2015_t:CDS:1, partial [Entrophospora sp. SA101]
ILLSRKTTISLTVYLEAQKFYEKAMLNAFGLLANSNRSISMALSFFSSNDI